MDPKKGLVTAICGPKFSGKTERLISCLNRWRANPYTKTCLVKYCNGTGQSFDTITSHGGVAKKADLIAESMEQVVSHAEENDIDVLAIDEAQLFRNLRANTELLAQNGVKVFLAGLDATFINHPAPGGLNEMARLLPRAEVIEKLLAMCLFCQKGAGFYFKRNPDLNYGLCDLRGGTDEFAAICRECYEDNKDSIANGLHCPYVLHDQEKTFTLAPEVKRKRDEERKPTYGNKQVGIRTGTMELKEASSTGKGETAKPLMTRQHSLVFVNPPNKNKTASRAETSSAQPDFSRIDATKLGRWVPWNTGRGRTEGKKESETESRTG